MRDGQKDYAISAFWSLLSSNSGMAHHVLIKKETTESELKRLSEGQIDKEKVPLVLIKSSLSFPIINKIRIMKSIHSLVQKLKAIKL